MDVPERQETPSPSDTEPKLVADERVLGRIADRLKFAEGDESLRALVGDAVYVANATDAAEIARIAGVTAVALDGTVARPDGVVEGGQVLPAATRRGAG